MLGLYRRANTLNSAFWEQISLTSVNLTTLPRIPSLMQHFNHKRKLNSSSYRILILPLANPTTTTTTTSTNVFHRSSGFTWSGFWISDFPLRQSDNCRLIWYQDVNPGVLGGRDPQILGWGGVGVAGLAVGVVDGSWSIIIFYHVQEACSKVVTFEDKFIEKFAQK